MSRLCVFPHLEGSYIINESEENSEGPEKQRAVRILLPLRCPCRQEDSSSTEASEPHENCLLPSLSPPLTSQAVWGRQVIFWLRTFLYSENSYQEYYIHFLTSFFRA